MKELLFIWLQYLTPQHGLSRCAGFLANTKITWIKNTFINLFAHHFQVDMNEAAQPALTHYETFNDFFTRALKDGARPIDNNANSIACPADGSISQVGTIDNDDIFQAKGKLYNACTLLGGNKNLAAPFHNGQFITIYLSPRDYHRVHMPVAAKLDKMIYVPGDLFSVNQQTANNVPNLFARNERLVCFFQTPAGPMAMVLVGAMIVAGIETVWAGQVKPMQNIIRRVDYQQQQINFELNKGDEMGRFKLGSTVILLFGEEALQWSEQLQSGREVKMGQSLGVMQ